MACSLVLATGALWYVYGNELFSLWPRAETDFAQESFWRERIRTVGANSAYEEFGRYEETQPTNYRHRLSHMFGAALYGEMGAEGLSTCNAEFEAGCLHEFFRHATREAGTAPLLQMEADCEKNSASVGVCEHAIGHGLLSHFGYDKKSLTEALDFCGRHFTSDPVLGCTGGVFMEYNGYTLLDSESSRPRDVSSGGWYEPCIDIPEQYQRSCAWWLPRWWNENLLLAPATYSQEALYEKMGRLCRNLPNQSYRRECFQATGQKIAFTAAWDIEKIKRLCDSATSDTAEDLYCRSYAATMFVYDNAQARPTYDTMMRGTSDTKIPRKARELCTDLPPASRDFCNAYADNTRYLYNELPPPTTF